jgi:predicted lysophospholipase L1 biosynthesis ABC-type transport system permease subunit
MSMGLRESDCLRINLYDWAITALIAATGAVAGTWLAGVLIYDSQFRLPYNPDPVWVGGMVAAMTATVCLVGFLACRESLRVSVRDLLGT